MTNTPEFFAAVPGYATEKWTRLLRRIQHLAASHATSLDERPRSPTADRQRLMKRHERITRYTTEAGSGAAVRCIALFFDIRGMVQSAWRMAAPNARRNLAHRMESRRDDAGRKHLRKSSSGSDGRPQRRRLWRRRTNQSSRGFGYRPKLP